MSGSGEKEEDPARARAARRLLTRLESRMRLEQLAATSHAVSQEQRALERLKYHYLPMWAELRRRDSIERGLPSENPLTNYMKPSIREFDQTAGEEQPDREVCAIVDSAIDELAAQGFSLARAVLAVRYMNAAGAAVYRSGRVEGLDPHLVEDLCDRAERMLVPIVKRKGLWL